MLAAIFVPSQAWGKCHDRKFCGGTLPISISTERPRDQAICFFSCQVSSISKWITKREADLHRKLDLAGPRRFL